MNVSFSVSYIKIKKGSNFLKPLLSLCGNNRIRTYDPLLVRQVLWTSWAMLPKFLYFSALTFQIKFSKSDAKISLSDKFQSFYCLFKKLFLQKYLMDTYTDLINGIKLKRIWSLRKKHPYNTRDNRTCIHFHFEWAFRVNEKKHCCLNVYGLIAPQILVDNLLHTV